MDLSRGGWQAPAASVGAPAQAYPHAVEVLAPARLHMGFIDPAGTAGRRFGSVGMAVDMPYTRVRVQAAEGLQVRGASDELARITRYVRALLDYLRLPHKVAVEVMEAMPSHAGLGSGTQLALALGAALSTHSGRPLSAARTATLLDRGGRSGIGIGAFEQGGFLVDGGKSARPAAPEPPPIIARCDIPAAWRVMLIFHRRFAGLSGERERTAFRELAKRSPPGVQAHANLVLMGMLPALVEGDLESFGSAITELQERVGDHFAPAQGGRFASPAVTEVLAWLRARGVAGVGQSSWGPTGFGLFPNEDEATAVLSELRAHGPVDEGELSFVIATPRNGAARIQALTTPTESAGREPKTPTTEFNQ